MQSIKLITTSVVVLAIILAALAQAAPSARGSSDNCQDEEPLPMGSDGSLYLAGNECGPDEELKVGHLPSCEPTCENPQPMCAKIFYTSIDYVPCFCKSPLVRNVKTKQCVPLSEC